MNRVNNEPPIAAVIGHPIAQSLSPEIFTFLAEQLKTPLCYEKRDVLPQNLSTYLQGEKHKCVGLNVTIPHKETMLTLVDELSPDAAGAGAVNVVHFLKGKSIGYNTDIYGVTATLKEQGFKARGKSIIVYGAGGAAKAVCFALGKEEVREIFVLNRHPERAQQLCQSLGKLFPKLIFNSPGSVKEVNTEAELLVNATPAGMPQINGDFELPYQLKTGVLAFDLLYHATMTPFLKAAQIKGVVGINGLDMLIWQAIRTWEIWFGPVGRKQHLKERLKNRLACLIGEK